MNDPAHKPNLRVLADDLPAGGPEAETPDMRAEWPDYDERAAFDREIEPLLRQLQAKLVEYKIPSVMVCLPHVNRLTGQIASVGFFNSFNSSARPAAEPMAHLADAFLQGPGLDTNTTIPPTARDRNEGDAT